MTATEERTDCHYPSVRTRRW